MNWIWTYPTMISASTTMVKTLKFVLIVFVIMGCKQSKTHNSAIQVQQSNIVQTATKPANEEQSALKATADEYVPLGYEVISQFDADVNQDGKPDKLMTIWGTDPKKIKKNEDGEDINNNRGGIIIALKHDAGYELAVANYECFSADTFGGDEIDDVVFDYYMKNNTLIFHFAHGRYGFWKYIFRYQNNDIELIGYHLDQSNGAISSLIEDVNFSTRTAVYKQNMNNNDEEPAKYKVKIIKFKRDNLIKLSEIADFDNLDLGLPETE